MARFLLPTRILVLALIALVTGSIHFVEAERVPWWVGVWTYDFGEVLARAESAGVVRAADRIEVAPRGTARWHSGGGFVLAGRWAAIDSGSIAMGFDDDHWPAVTLTGPVHVRLLITGSSPQAMRRTAGTIEPGTGGRYRRDAERLLLSLPSMAHYSGEDLISRGSYRFDPDGSTLRVRFDSHWDTSDGGRVIERDEVRGFRVERSGLLESDGALWDLQTRRESR